MLIILRDCFVEARVDPDDPNRVFVYSRQRGDIERFAAGANVKRSQLADHEFSAVLSMFDFEESLRVAMRHMAAESLAESVSARDIRRRTLYGEIASLTASRYGAFGIPGTLEGLNPGYPPDSGLPDDPDIHKYLTGKD